jgi:hypothetical protein
VSLITLAVDYLEAGFGTGGLPTSLQLIGRLLGGDAARDRRPPSAVDRLAHEAAEGRRVSGPVE